MPTALADRATTDAGGPGGVLAERDVRFEWPTDADVRWSGHVPEFACAANAVSLLMPFVEPYVARSVRGCIDDLDDDVLRRAARGYVRQELAHHAQHRRFNELLVAQVPAMRHVERAARATIAHLARRNDRGAHLAFAAGAEAVAYSAARWAAEHRRELFASADPEVTRLFVWHLAEEVEHKTVAHDVFHAISGSRRRHAVGMLLAFVVLATFTVAGTTVQLWHARRLWHPVAIARLVRWTVTFLFELLPAMAVALLPGHHPRDLADPAYLVQWLAELDAAGPGTATR